MSLYEKDPDGAFIEKRKGIERRHVTVIERIDSMGFNCTLILGITKQRGWKNNE